MPAPSSFLFLRARVLLHELDVGVHHVLDEVVEGDLGHPLEQLARLGGVAEQLLHLGGAVVLGVDAHADGAGALLLADLVVALALPLDLLANVPGIKAGREEGMKKSRSVKCFEEKFKCLYLRVIRVKGVKTGAYAHIPACT